MAQTTHSKRGFAAMDEDQQKEAAGKGGKASHQGVKHKPQEPRSSSTQREEKSNRSK